MSKNLQEIVNLELINHHDTNATTIKEFLKNLLEVLWSEGESFSGKRPFGNSGWDWELYATLIHHGVVKGKLDSDNCIEKLSEPQRKKANQIIFDCIDEIFK
jgi:hypothetical protein